MRTWLRVSTLLAVALAFGISFVMLQRVVGAASAWLPLLAMFYFLALSRVAEPLITLRVPAALRPVRRWELRGQLHRALAVPAFGRLLRRTPLRHFNPNVYLDASPDAAELRLRLESGEAAHFWAGVLLMSYIGYAGLAGRWQVVGWFLLAQVVVNVYPILHLRLVRGRLDRLQARRRSRIPPRSAAPS